MKLLFNYIRNLTPDDRWIMKRRLYRLSILLFIVIGWIAFFFFYTNIQYIHYYYWTLTIIFIFYVLAKLWLLIKHITKKKK